MDGQTENAQPRMTRLRAPKQSPKEGQRGRAAVVEAAEQLNDNFNEQSFAHRLIAAIKSQREADGKKASAIAERMGVNKSVVSRLESGKGNPTMDTVEAYAKAAGYKIEFFLEP